MVKKNTLKITESELINLISETVISLSEQTNKSLDFHTGRKDGNESIRFTDGNDGKPKKKDFNSEKIYLSNLKAYYKTVNGLEDTMVATFGGDCNPFGGIIASNQRTKYYSMADKMYMNYAESYLKTILMNIDQRSGWSRNKTIKKYGSCRYGIFGKSEGETLYDNLITNKYCKPTTTWSSVDKYVKNNYATASHPSGNWLWALSKEVGTTDMCKISKLLKIKVNYDWDSVGLRGLVNACKGSPWKCLEYTADAIAIIALFFGPPGWVVGSVAGLVSVYSLYEQDEYGWAIAVGALEVFGIFKIIKHIKKVKHLKGVGDESIAQAIKFFDGPTKEAFQKLSPDAQKVVTQMRNDKNLIKSIVEETSSSNARSVINAVSDEKEFIELVKRGTIDKLDEIGWEQFQQIQKNIKYSDKVLKNVEKGIKAVATGAVVLTGAALLLDFLQNKINIAILKGNISRTKDYITGAKLDNVYHYRYDRVMNGTYPYNDSMVQAEYKELLNNDILGLNKIWYDKKTFPEITNYKIVDGLRNTNLGNEGDKIQLAGTCVGVNLEHTPNKGGGWRPNLECLEGYSLRELSLGEEGKAMEKLLKSLDDDEITREEFNDGVEEKINIPSEIAAKFDLEYSSEDVWD
tara:strand:- start:2038 stop:3933 length:1896 start_codon:yes stop_codon:yes gene_type:complete